MRQTVRDLESIFTNICRASHPYEWDENHVSFQLMRELRYLFAHRVINFNDWSKIVDWRSYKNKGKQETNFGDIALLVHVQFTSGELLKGVACLEAKRDFDSNCFESMDVSQLERLYDNVPHSQLLLYNHEIRNLQLKFPDDKTWKSHIWVSPVNTAKEHLEQTRVNDNWKVLRTSFPFSMFITGRIFWGFDLDYRTSVYDDILSGVQKVFTPSYLGVVNVYYDHQRPREVNLGETWQEIT